MIGYIENSTRGLPASTDGFPSLREVCPGWSENVVRALAPVSSFCVLSHPFSARCSCRPLRGAESHAADIDKRFFWRKTCALAAKWVESSRMEFAPLAHSMRHSPCPGSRCWMNLRRRCCAPGDDRRGPSQMRFPALRLVRHGCRRVDLKPFAAQGDLRVLHPAFQARMPFDGLQSGD